MNRKEFLQTAGTGSTLLLTPGLIGRSLSGLRESESELFHIPRPLDIKVNVKPLFGIRIPAELHEGPCRPENPLDWDRAKEIANAKEEFAEWKQQTINDLGPDVNVLKPEYVEYAGDHIIERESWERILADDQVVDVYMLNHYRIPGLGFKTEKPMLMVGDTCATLDVSAKMRKEGHKIFGALDMKHAKDYIRALKTKKALATTKVLVVSDGKWDYEFNNVRSNLDKAIMTEKFGFDAMYVSIKEMMDHFEQCSNNKEFQQEAERISEKLITEAQKNSMEKIQISKSVMYYLTAKSMMQEKGCNAFTATCQEFCVSKKPMQHQVTPCLTHSLLKDEGYASGCEADLNAVFSISMQMCLAERTPYMGNTLVKDLEKNIISITHDVPGMKMMGYDQPDLPYSIMNFTERNWGATLRYDFNRDKEKQVTFCRMSPNLDKMLVVKGNMQSGSGLEHWGCTLQANIKVPDAMEYFKAAQDTGHHFSMVYGDYTRLMRTTAEVLGMEIVELS